MKTLKVLSALLCYPQPDLQAALGAMAEALDAERLLPGSRNAGRCRTLMDPAGGQPT
jgi:nitrate reductase assembly molybdenum cofactor insertion protein NarJ